MSQMMICPKAEECDALLHKYCRHIREHEHVGVCDNSDTACPACSPFPEPEKPVTISDEYMADCYREHWSTKLVEDGDNAIKAKFAELKASALQAYTPMEMIIHLMSRPDCQVLKEIEYPNNQGIERNYLYLAPSEFLVVLPAEEK